MLWKRLQKVISYLMDPDIPENSHRCTSLFDEFYVVQLNEGDMAKGFWFPSILCFYDSRFFEKTEQPNYAN